MLSLPEKPWFRVRLEPLDTERYSLTFLDELENEQGLRELVDESVVPALGPEDALVEIDWATRSAALAVANIADFKRNLVYQGLVIDDEAS